MFRRNGCRRPAVASAWYGTCFRDDEGVIVDGILLDTNILLELMSPNPAPRVVNWFHRQQGALYFVSSITRAEIMLSISLLPVGGAIIWSWQWSRCSMRTSTEKVWPSMTIVRLNMRCWLPNAIVAGFRSALRMPGLPQSRCAMIYPCRLAMSQTTRG